MSGNRALPGTSRLADMLAIGAVGVDEQHGDRHRADAAGNGGERLRDRLDARPVDIARELAGLGIAGDADVDDDGARLDVLAGYESAFASGSDQDIGGPGDGR